MITAEQVLAAARAGESETQEFKRSTGEQRSAMHALTAMLNHRGGRVFFGIEPDQHVVGQQVSDRTLEELAQEIAQIEPPVFPAVERVVVAEGREVLVVMVTQGPGRPYSHRGVPYRRVGNVNARMSRDEYNRLLLETLHAERRWENELAEGWTVVDLDADEIVRTVDEAVRRGRDLI